MAVFSEELLRIRDAFRPYWRRQMVPL